MVAIRSGYCVFIDTVCQGPVPVVRDQNGYVVFETELEAQLEIIDDLQIRLQQFLDGEISFEEAILVEEYVAPVTVRPGGVITDEAGNSFDPNAV